jgi:peptidoglycan/LPS O-acetylase OafA/YrhL
MNTSAPPRLTQLDGLRGIAIVLVILSHLRLQQLLKVLPPSLSILGEMFSNSGKTGVTILFVLSGFLMASLYPKVPSWAEFLQKRYTRIFPAFLTMCLALSLVRFWWDRLSAPLLISILVMSMWVGGWLWRRLQASPQRKTLGKTLFWSLLGFQILVGVGYLALTQFVPSAVYYLIWPKWSQAIITWIVNSTATLPLGRYVPQLDGVYWSIVIEILFYLLYPSLFIPLVQALKRSQNKVLLALTLLSVLPFFIGLGIVFERVLGLHLIQVELTAFFVAGIGLAQLLKSELWQKYSTQIRIPAIIAVGVALFTLWGQPLLYQSASNNEQLFKLIWIFPILGLFLLSFQKNNIVPRVLSHPWLLKLGEWSYSLYLTHSISIELISKNGEPTTAAQAAIAGVASLILTFALALVLHYRLERPYFLNRLERSKEEKVKTSKSRYWTWIPVSLLSLLILSAVWFAFRTPVTLSATVARHINTAVSPRTLLQPEPLRLPFTAASDSLGMVIIALSSAKNHEVADDQTNLRRETETQVHATLLDDADNVIAQSRFAAYSIIDSPFFVIGLPIIPDSAGKNYTLELAHPSANPFHHFVLVNDGTALRSVYYPDKKILLKNPILLTKHLLTKLIQPFTEEQTQRTLLLLSPLLGTLILTQAQTASVSYNKQKK